MQKHEMQKEEKSRVLVASESKVTMLTIDFVTADIIGISFRGMPGNQPSTYGNFIAIWQNHNEIPWSASPLAAKPIPNNTPTGSLAFDGLLTTNNDYILGYSVGPEKAPADGQKWGNICSTAYVPPQGSEPPPDEYFQTKISIRHIGSTSLAVQFNTPSGYKPQTNKNWMGLWRGETASYVNPPDYSTPITVDANFGTAAFNNINIGRGLTYTVGYFMSGWIGQGQANKQTGLACSVSFTNS